MLCGAPRRPRGAAGRVTGVGQGKREVKGLKIKVRKVEAVKATVPPES